LIDKLGGVGIVGDGIAGYGCPDIDPLCAGLITMELSRGDGSVATCVSVQAGLAMRSIAMLGSEEQKQRWLRPMARLEKLGAFALTEADHGSDSIALETTVRPDGDHWTLDGHGSGSATAASPTSSWCGPVTSPTARSRASSSRRARPATRPRDRGQGLAAGGMAGRDRPGRRPRRRREPVPGARSFRDTAAVLAATRASCAWAVLGHAFAGHAAALTYAKRRTPFGKPLVGFQLIQNRLVKMLAKVTAIQLYCRRIADLQAADTLDPTLAGLAKMHNTCLAREVLAEARTCWRQRDPARLPRHPAHVRHRVHPHLRRHRVDEDAHRRPRHHRRLRLRLNPRGKRS
jgi:glutaryl-CoA dehydrogenase